MKQNKKYSAYLLSFILPLVTVLAVFAVLGLGIFGNKNVLVSDLGAQYLPFLTNFKRFFAQGGESLYSFANGIGGPMEPLIAYYLMSPLNFIALLFPYEVLPTVILGLISLKIALMGLTMFTYLDLHYKDSSLFTQTFSLSYSLCGFVVVYLLNFMWLDVLVVFPILVLGLEKLWLKQQPLLYGISLFLAIILNYYLGYMVCIFAVVYSAYLYFLHYMKPGARRSFKTVCKDWWLFIISSLLSGLATAFMLVPAVVGMLKTGKSSFDLSTFKLVPRFGLEALSQMGMGTVNYDIRLDHLPMIYSGIFIWLLFFVYFFLPNVPKRKKKAMAGLLIFVYFSFLLEGFNTIWHMFQSPAGFPYRNAFIFSFLLIKLAYETFLYAKENPDQQLVYQRLRLGTIVYIVLLSVGQIFLNITHGQAYLLTNKTFYLSIIASMLFLVLLPMSIKKPNTLKISVVVLLVMMELGGNLWFSMKDIPFGNQATYERMYREQETVLNGLQKKPEVLTRINHRVPFQKSGYAEKNNGYNNPLLFGYAGVSSYTSTLESGVQRTLEDMGLYALNERRFSYVDESSVANLMLNVGYTVSAKQMPTKTKLGEVYEMNRYLNPEAVGIGFLVPEDLQKTKLVRREVLINQERILQGISPSLTPYFAPLIKSDIQKDGLTTVISGVTQSNGAVYLYLPYVDWEDIIQLSINHQPVQSDLLILKNQLFNLGTYHAGTEIKLSLKAKKPLDTYQMYWATLDQAKFDELIAKEKQQSLQLTRGKYGSWEGTVNVTDDKEKLLYLSIPYDANWRVLVDGKKTELKPILREFSSLELSTGKHDIKMNYVSKSFWLGAMISFASILCALVLIFYQRWQRNKKK